MPVQMNVMAHQLVGAYVSRLATAAERPATVGAMMAELADFVNEQLNVEAMQAQYDAHTHTWRIPGVLELIGVNENAAMSFFENTPDNIVIRLPDAKLLAESRNLAVAFDVGRKKGGFAPSAFYRDYAQGGPYEVSNSDFLDSRIADYVFASCK